MAQFSTVPLVTCAGCGKRLPKDQLKGVGNQYACTDCLSIWNLVISPIVAGSK